MAAVTCAQCTALLDPGLMVCPVCLVPVYQHVGSDPVELPVAEPPGGTGRADGVDECPRVWCRADLPPGATSCPECDLPLAAAPSGGPIERVLVRFADDLLLTLLPGRRLELGRESDDDRVARWLDAYPDVSRVHARVVVTTNEVTLEDLRSTNGTTVDGTRISGPVALCGLSASVELGRAVTLVMEIRRGGPRP